MDDDRLGVGGQGGGGGGDDGVGVQQGSRECTWLKYPTTLASRWRYKLRPERALTSWTVPMVLMMLLFRFFCSDDDDDQQTPRAALGSWKPQKFVAGLGALPHAG
ncbi:hypothetical protein F5B22DRAFT_650713 [Xylaria bambusicola]|uniref:uncharacterized protein n=1 Tax=Xylaria bambusicola TaxID=326684 RepID=UPI002008AE49|nr:uncharacterized protein F5B22DRAFT_650713 [Xylaria bambusicola]KAI0506462.1 hypothetical protein F5B22DRAFT_650713 [Xylaria bambusicola]